MPPDPPLPPAGWYPDPSGAHRRRRYWDGRAWTDAFAEAATPPPLAMSAVADRAADLKLLQDNGRRARMAVLGAVPLYAVTPALQGQQVRESRRAIADLRDQLEQTQQVPGTQVRPYTPAAGTSLSSALSLPTLVIGVLFLIWFHRAATVAIRLGRPARHTTGWAVGGWLVPIVNFFFPYQSAQDMFRADEAGRRIVKQWWAAYLLAVAVNLPLGVIVGFNDGVEVSIAAGALAFVVWLLAAIKAREFIDAANESLSAEQ